LPLDSISFARGTPTAAAFLSTSAIRAAVIIPAGWTVKGKETVDGEQSCGCRSLELSVARTFAHPDRIVVLIRVVFDLNTFKL
jgi:hypothetical protein